MNKMCDGLLGSKLHEKSWEYTLAAKFMKNIVMNLI